jgi:hypothetical protein
MKSSKSATVMKWIGYGTAVLSLIAGVREIEKVVSGRLEAARKIDALLSSEALQLKGQDYWSAWRDFREEGAVPAHDTRLRQ